MRTKLSQLILSVLALGLFSGPLLAEKRYELGVSLMTGKTDTNDEYDVHGVLFANYDGYEYNITEDRLLNLVPTTAEVSVGGKRVRVYTDLATYEHYGADNLDIVVSAISIDYDHLDSFAIQRSEKAAILDVSATTYKELGFVQFDFTAGVSAGGYTKANVMVRDAVDPKTINEFDFKDNHRATIDFSVGGDINIVDDVDLYFYYGRYRQFGKDTTEDGIYAGATLYGGQITDELPFTISVEYQKRTLESQRIFFERIEDDAIGFFFRMPF